MSSRYEDQKTDRQPSNKGTFIPSESKHPLKGDGDRDNPTGSAGDKKLQPTERSDKESSTNTKQK